MIALPFRHDSGSALQELEKDSGRNLISSCLTGVVDASPRRASPRPQIALRPLPVLAPSVVDGLGMLANSVLCALRSALALALAPARSDATASVSLRTREARRAGLDHAVLY